MAIEKNLFGDKNKDIGNLLRNIGLVYEDLGDFKKAFDYH